mgnify:CR=1 FL=1
MKKLFVVALTIFTVFSCGKEEQDFVTIAGKIDNANSDSVFIVKDNFRKGIPVVNGEFKDTLKLVGNSYFEFYSGNERTEIYLSQGDSLFISTDMQEFDEKLKYRGTSEKENNYLAQKQLKTEQIYVDPAAFFSVDPNSFKSKVTAYKTELNADLNQEGINKVFKESETKNIDYFYYMMLAQYPMAHQYFTQQEAYLPADFDEEIKKLNLENEADFNSIPAYKQFVLYKVSNQISEAKTPDEIEKIISNIKTPQIKDAVMKEFLLYFVASGSPDSERYHNYIQKNAKDKKIKKESTEAFAKVQKLLPGKLSPKFSYPDITGKTVSLDDLKGKLVYVDVWATWCGPCIREIPSLKQLEKDYHGKNIEFVSMSIDPQQDKGKWENMVKEKDLKGIQIFADKDWKSQFVQEYGIKGIPRFILIDASGNILNADAPRPSDPQIRTLIDQNLKS